MEIKLSGDYWKEKLNKELASVTSDKASKVGLTIKANKKVEGYYWAIPSMNLRDLFLENVDTKDTKQNKILSVLKDNNICNKERCKTCSNYCYNLKGYFYKNNISSRFNRLLALIENKEELKARINKQLEKPKSDIVRIHTDGEFFSKEYLQWWLDIAKENKHIKFYTYTKQYELFKGVELPKNMFVQISYNNTLEGELDTVKSFLKLKNYNIYYTYEKEEEIKDLGVESMKCKGKCETCRQCYTNINKVQLCKLH